MLLNDIEIPHRTSLPVTQYYLKKTLLFLTQLIVSILLSLSLLSLFGKEVSTNLMWVLFGGIGVFGVLQISIFLNSLYYSSNERIFFRKAPKDNRKINHLLSVLKNKLSIHQKHTLIYSIEPKITIDIVNNNKIQIHLGLPLLVEISNNELYALLFFKLSIFKLSQTQMCKRFLPKYFHNTLMFRSTNKTLNFRNFLTYQKNIGLKAIEDSLLKASIRLTCKVFDHNLLLDALEKESRLYRTYKNYIHKAQQGDQLIPIHVVTQIIVENKEKHNHFDQDDLYFDFVKRCILGLRNNSAEERSIFYNNSVYPAYFLMNKINEYSEELSIEFFKTFGFTEKQLSKTHVNTHKAFKDNHLNVAIKKLSLGSFRLNTPTLPQTIIEQNTSLISMKQEVMGIKHQQEKILQDKTDIYETWDQYLAPFSQRKNNQVLERAFLEIEDLKVKTSQRIGLGLLILLSTAKPKHKETIENLIQAYSQTSALNHTADEILSLLLEVQNNSDIHSDVHYKNRLLHQKMNFLIQKLYKTHDILDLHKQLNKLEITSYNIKNIQAFARDLLQLYYHFVWEAAGHIFYQCDQIEKRLGL